MVFDRKRPREQWCCPKVSCHHHPIANDKTQKKKKKIYIYIYRKKEEGKRWVKKVALNYGDKFMWCEMLWWTGSLAPTMQVTERERRRHTQIVSHSFSHANIFGFWGFANLPLPRCMLNPQSMSRGKNLLDIGGRKPKINSSNKYVSNNMSIILILCNFF